MSRRSPVHAHRGAFRCPRHRQIVAVPVSFYSAENCPPDIAPNWVEVKAAI